MAVQRVDGRGGYWDDRWVEAKEGRRAAEWADKKADHWADR